MSWVRITGCACVVTSKKKERKKKEHNIVCVCVKSYKKSLKWETNVVRSIFCEKCEIRNQTKSIFLNVISYWSKFTNWVCFGLVSWFYNHIATSSWDQGSISLGLATFRYTYENNLKETTKVMVPKRAIWNLKRLYIGGSNICSLQIK